LPGEDIFFTDFLEDCMIYVKLACDKSHKVLAFILVLLNEDYYGAGGADEICPDHWRRSDRSSECCRFVSLRFRSIPRE
jgi:hypothetical protein